MLVEELHVRCTFSFEYLTTHEASSGAGGVGFAIRAGVNLILLLTRIKRIPKCVPRICILESSLNQSHRSQRLAVIQHALFGEDCFRFAGMLGTCGVHPITASTEPSVHQGRSWASTSSS